MDKNHVRYDETMPTTKQRKAIAKMVENGGVVSRAMEDAGYSPATANTPSKLTASKGFQELCEKYGLTDGLLVKSLVKDIKAKPKNRKAELELGFKIKGRLNDNKDPGGDTNNTLIIFGSGQAEAVARRLLAGGKPSEEEPR